MASFEYLQIWIYSNKGLLRSPRAPHPVSWRRTVTMRIVGVTTFGGPERLQLLEAPEPHAGPGEVRIRVHAATINPTDVGLRQGCQGYQLPGRGAPLVPGKEAA